MGSGGVAIAALPTVICLKVPFSDGLGGGRDGERGNLIGRVPPRAVAVRHGSSLGEKWRERESDWESPIPDLFSQRKGLRRWANHPLKRCQGVRHCL